MAKKKIDDKQPQAVVEVGPEGRQAAPEQKAPKSGIVTTEGNVIDKVRVFQQDGVTKVQVDYGKYNPAGKTSEERRANMRVQHSRTLTPEQSKEYQRLNAEDPIKAKDYVVRAAYPMHVDDAAFHQKDTVINGRKVNYIILEKLDADKLTEGNKHLAGSWQLSFGEKGNDASRFFSILSKNDLASIRHRAEVTLDEKGQVKSVGAPLSLADIAGRVENRVLAQRAAKANWSQFKFPDGVALTQLRYIPSKDPGRVWLNGKLNGIEVRGLLTVDETTAVKSKMATLVQVAAANKDFSSKVFDILGSEQAQSVDKDAAVKVVVDRTSDPAARSFSAEQVKTLNDFASGAGANDPEAREQIFDDLWKTAEPSLKEKGVNEAWQKDAREELKDLAGGVVRHEQQSMHR